MRAGDLALFYHSNAKPAGVAGVARVVRAAYPDDLQFDPGSAYQTRVPTRPSRAGAWWTCRPCWPSRPC